MIFSLQGELDRRRYAAASAAVLLVQFGVVWAVFQFVYPPVSLPWWAWLNPFRAVAFAGPAFAAQWVAPLAMIGSVGVAWMLASLALRRAANSQNQAGLATLVIVPIVQIPVIAWLAVARFPKVAPEVAAPSQSRARTMIVGLFAGVALTVGAVALSAIVLGLYGYTLFVITPCVVGLTIGYAANQAEKISFGATMSLVWAGFGLGAAVLVATAFEGVVCLLFASPLIALMGLIGAAIGRAVSAVRKKANTAVVSLVFLPALMFGEAAIPPHAGFESVESIEVAAPPAAVWDSIVHMGPIPDAPAAPFRWGLAYPMRGAIFGAGVGAVREGMFSTGVAYERVTEWKPNERLTFIVLSDPPMMHEFSPYRHVNAPHVEGYFKTLDARFTIIPLRNGHTRLTLTTNHELRLEPALYWLPFVNWAVHANKVRVLQHFRDQAEATSRRA